MFILIKLHFNFRHSKFISKIRKNNVKKTHLIPILLLLSCLTLFSQESALEITEEGGEVKVTVDGTLRHQNGNSYDALPVGTILMFDAANWIDNNTLPGWYACTVVNSVNNTIPGGGVPNLENQFIMGSSSTGTTGGVSEYSLTSAQLPSHSHGAASSTQSQNHTHSVSGGSHIHQVAVPNIYDGFQLVIGYQNPGALQGLGMACSTNNYSIEYVTTDRSGDELVQGGAHTHTVGDNSSGHTHTITIDPTGSGAVIDNRPSYYTVIYIRKCEQ